MRHRLLMLPLVACAILLVVSAGASAACERGSHACCATSSAAFVPLPSSPVPVLAAPFAMFPAVEPQPVVAGLRAFLDPETGLITSPIGSMLAPVDGSVIEADYSNLPQIQLPDGSFMIDTRGIMMDDFMVRIDALGHRSFACSRDANAAPAPVLAPTTSPYAER
jgi:hypothetical protein